MSVPGNSVVLLVLLSLFVGCAGYALGRLHERRMSGEEREEAYRDGYDHAARSVFSLAARVAGPRRRGAVRASATVSEGDPQSGDSAPAATPAGESRTGGSAAATSDSEPVPGRRRAPAGKTAGKTAEKTADPVVDPAAGPTVPVAQTFGFPAPAPHVVPGLPTPAADGGVNYSSLPDPQFSAKPQPTVKPEPAAKPSADPVTLPAPRARHSAEPESAGRHTVPDELVRAATYKLPADRVARAKVRRPEDPADPPVPRPRG